MGPATALAPLPGSERKLPKGARMVGPADPQQEIDVSLYLRPRTSLEPSLRAAVATRKHLTRDEFCERHGIAANDLAQVQQFADASGLRVVTHNSTSRRVLLAGSVEAVSNAFGVELARYERNGRHFRGRVGALHLPAHLLGIVQSVHGLDDRPQAKPHFRFRPHLDPSQGQVYTPPQVAELYEFPQDGDGSGQCIGIIELGGGYRQSDLDIYFSEVGITTPKVSSISVNGADNSPGDDADVEVALDIEVAGSIAPGATIAVYFAPNDDQGFIDAVNTAIFDNVHKTTAISVSWGKAEAEWSEQSMRTMDHAFQSAALLGISVCVASGDDGSRDDEDDGNAHVDFPSSSPFALACGGTTLLSSGGAITSETAWTEHGATGGGISDFFDLPSWQLGFNVPNSVNSGHRVGRGVPDVSGNADPVTPYKIRVDGVDGTVGGTSAVAPLVAAMIALINEQLLTPLGHVNPALYGDMFNQAEVCRDVISGNNGAYHAHAGWDACTGLGSVDGESWLAALIY